MAAGKPVLLLAVSALLLCAVVSVTIDDDGEDLTFLEEPKPPKDYPDYADPNYKPEGEEEAEIYGGSYEDYRAWSNPHAPPPPVVDEKDVVVLTNATFEEFVNNTDHTHVMVQFYAPWCGYCQSLAPEYAAAATELKKEGSGVVLAKVDAIQESDLADQFKVEGFPSIFLFSHGVHLPYGGDRTKEAIVSWLKKKTGSAIKNVTTTEEAKKLLDSEPKLVVAFLDSLTGSDSEEFNDAAKLEDDANFYQTNSPDVAKIFQFDSQVKRPAVVLLKNEAEKLSLFDGNFSKSAILEFVSANKHPLVINFTRESAPLVFENPPIKKQMYLFASAAESEKLISLFQEAAKGFKGKLMFVYIERDNEDYGKPVVDFFGIVGDAPLVLAYTGNADGKKYLLDGEVTLDKIKSFAEDFLADMLKPYYKSDPIPETNDGNVKIVVGKNFDEIVLDESKDVLLEIYAPWCPYCQSLEPTYNKLAMHLKGVDSIVIAKMDGTKNEHPKAKASDGFPTILFYPAGKKSSDPIIVDSERTAVALYKFLKKHVTTPFKTQKPAVEAPSVDSAKHTSNHESVASVETLNDYDNEMKDEL